MYNFKIYIPFKDVFNNPYPLWNSYILGLLSKSNCYILLNKNISIEEQRKKLASFYEFYGSGITPKETKNIDQENRYNYLLNFGNEISNRDKQLPKTDTVGFIGFGVPFNDTIDYFREINCNLIVSEILPNEIPSDITQENLDFFIQNYYFLPPNPTGFKIGFSKEKKISLFIDSKNNESNAVYKKIYSAISKSSEIEVIDVNAPNGQPEKILATSVITYLLNPQYQLAIRYASPLEVKEIDGKESMKNPLRDMFIEKSNINSNHLFKKRNSSIRYQLKSLFEKDPQTSVDNNPTFSFEEELDKLIKKISTCHSNTPSRSKNIYKVAKERKTSNGTDLPPWLNHFGTEPFLNEILTRHPSEESEGNISFNENFYNFAKDAYYLVHILDSEQLHASNFASFFGKPTDEKIKKFRVIINKLHDFGKANLIKFSGIETKLAYKFIRTKFSDVFINKNGFIDHNSYELLLDLIMSCSEFKADGLTPKMHLIILSAIGNRPEEAIKICEQQTSVANSNILYATNSLCLALQGEKEASRQAMSHIRPLDSQYAKDNVTVKFLLAKALVSDLNDKESEEVILSYAKRKPSQKWWGTDLIYLALAKVIPSDNSSKLLAMCKEHLLDCNILSENEFNEIHLSPKDHDETALAKFFSFLQFPN